MAEFVQWPLVLLLLPLTLAFGVKVLLACAVANCCSYVSHWCECVVGLCSCVLLWLPLMLAFDVKVLLACAVANCCSYVSMWCEGVVGLCSCLLGLWRQLHCSNRMLHFWLPRETRRPAVGSL